MLTVKQQRFVEAYNGNATRAAIEAGYSPKWATKFGPNLIGKNREVADAIREREQERTDSMIATREERQSFWTSVLRDPDESMRDRLKASELLGRSEADFLEKWLDTTPPTPPSIEVVFVRADTALDS